jgi:hypothetical protein
MLMMALFLSALTKSSFLKIEEKLSSVGCGGYTFALERSAPVFSDVLISQ